MKKYPFIFVIFFMMTFLTIPVYADRTYTISDYVTDVIINEDGSADITEKITYNFNGDFNGIFYYLDYDKDGFPKNINLYSYTNSPDNKKEFTNSNNESLGTFKIEDNGKNLKFTVYEKSSNTEKTFVFKYTLPYLITNYNDTAQFNRNMIGENWETQIEKFSLNMKFQHESFKDDLKIFVHGPLHGNSKLNDDGTISLSIDGLYPGEKVEVNALFPTSYTPSASKLVNENKLNDILNKEQTFADDANKEREEAIKQMEAYEKEKQKKSLYNSVIAVFSFIIGIPILIYMHIKYNREYSVSFHEEYFRELPGDYSPAETGYLINFKKTKSEAVFATILNLVRLGYLKMETVIVKNKKFLGNTEEEDIRFSVTEKRDYHNLKKHEQFLIKWLVRKVGNSEYFDLDHIQKCSLLSARAMAFAEDYDTWCGYVEIDSNNNDFFERTSQAKNVGLLIGFVLMILGMFLVIKFAVFSAVLLIFFGFIIMIYGSLIKKRTRYGQEQYEKWMALKRFLKDFSQMDTYKIESIVIWEYYLIYGIVLGVSKEVIKIIPKIFSSDDLMKSGSNIFGYDPVYAGRTIYRLDRSFNSFNQSITKAVNYGHQEKTAKIAASSMSSGSGGGGGFSSGSSGGSGGGGGGGAF